MRKLLSGGLAVFAGMVAMPSHVSTQQTAPVAAPDYRDDPRLQTLRAFFERADCPAVAYSGVFLEAADLYDLDWRLLPSISFVESSGGKSAKNNNFFGWDSGHAEFPSPVAAIHTVGYRLAHSDLYRNKGTDEILATYNPRTEYVAKVKQVMRRIASTE
jgi:hypothetical protein